MYAAKARPATRRPRFLRFKPPTTPPRLGPIDHLLGRVAYGMHERGATTNNSGRAWKPVLTQGRKALSGGFFSSHDLSSQWRAQYGSRRLFTQKATPAPEARLAEPLAGAERLDPQATRGKLRKDGFPLLTATPPPLVVGRCRPGPPSSTVKIASACFC